MNSTSSLPKRFPAFRRFGRWLFSWRTLRRTLIGLAGLVTLLGVFATVEEIRGLHAWHAAEAEAKAMGESLDPKSVIPPAVPDDQNFAMAPLLKSIPKFVPPMPGQLGNPANRNSAVGPSRQGQADGDGWTNFTRVTRVGYSAPLGSWQDRRLSDLAGYAEALRKKPGLPTAASNQPPAAEILAAMQVVQPQLEELRKASRRPYARFNISYSEGAQSSQALLPILSKLKEATIVLTWRAVAEIAEGQMEPAFRDTQFDLRLSQKLDQTPFLISYLVMAAQTRAALTPIYEGLARRQWSDAQLVALENDLSQIDLFASLRTALRGERNLGLISMQALWQNLDRGFLARLMHFLISGWFQQNRASIARLYLDDLPQIINFSSRRFYPARARAVQAKLNQRRHGFHPYEAFADLLQPAIGAAAMHAPVAQTWVDEARVACALERYRLKHGQFPEQLGALVPAFLSAVPKDVCTGKSLKYRRTPDGLFVLYSVGDNLKDDGGQTGYKQNIQRTNLQLYRAFYGHKPPPEIRKKLAKEQARQASEAGGQRTVDLTQGDWAWGYPATP